MKPLPYYRHIVMSAPVRSCCSGAHDDSHPTGTNLDAVVAGLTMGYNSGAVEGTGTVNRIKQLKAAMYGRAKPDLLRKLILLA